MTDELVSVTRPNEQEMDCQLVRQNAQRVDMTDRCQLRRKNQQKFSPPFSCH